MSETKHTPGPWGLPGNLLQGGNKRFRRFQARDSNGHEICIKEFYGYSIPQFVIEENLANAHLIAAAPELLKAVEWLVSEFPNMTDEEFDKFDKLIKKAKGGL